MERALSRGLSRLLMLFGLGAAMLAASLMTLLALPSSPARASTLAEDVAETITKTAYVVVRYGDNDTVVRRVEFTSVISDWRLLELAGLNPAGIGGLASINGYGNPDNDPFGNVSTRYWATYHKEGSGWMWNSYGVTQAAIEDDGHIEGFSWSDLNWSDPGPPAPLQGQAVGDAMHWLRKQQATDGSYTGGAADTAEVMMAVAGNGCDPAEWRNGTGNPSLLDAVSDAAAGWATNAGAAGKLAVALVAAQQPVTDFNGMDIVISITTHYSPTTGAYHAAVGSDAWALLGLAAAGETVPVTATDWLTSAIVPKVGGAGCWEWSAGWGCDTNSTALATQALIAHGIPVSNAAIISATAWLSTAQNTDGGWPYDPVSAWGTASDTDSSAYVMQALLAAGVDLASMPHGSPFPFIKSLQQNNGQIYYQVGDEGMTTYATRQAIPAILERPFPTSSVAQLTTCTSNDRVWSVYGPVVIKD